MTGALYGLGRFCARHRWPVLAVWLVIFAALALAARSAGPEVNDNLTLPGSDSQRASDVLSERFPSQANGTNPVVLRAPQGHEITGSRYKTPIDDTVAALRKDPDVRKAVSPLGSDGSSLVSKDSKIGYIALSLRPSPSELSTDDAERIVALADPARDAGLSVGFGGYLGQKVSKPETHVSEVVGLSMAVIVLLLTFGTVVAMGLPIVTALIGLVSGLSIITLLSHISEVPTVAPTLATMIGLGVGIDYALFIVTRHRAQRRDGIELRESIARAVATSGGAVVFAGCTVIVALLSLAVVGIPLVTTLGYTAALVVLVAVTAAVTLLPALLAIVGERIDSLAIPLRHARDDGTPHGWARWGRFVANRPLPSALAAIVVLVALAVPALDLYLGQQDNGALPTDTDSRRAYDGMTERLRGRQQRAAARQRRYVGEAREGRPVAARRAVQAGEERQAAGAGQGRQAGDADRGVARGAGRAAGRGAAAGAGPGPAAARQADAADLQQGGRPAQEGRAARDRPAAAGPARRPAQGRRRRQGLRAARQRRRQRRGAHRHAVDRAVGPRHRDADPRAARHDDPGRHQGAGHDRVGRRHDRRLRGSRRRDLEPARRSRSASSSASASCCCCSPSGRS